jgi:hypothetical protein
MATWWGEVLAKSAVMRGRGWMGDGPRRREDRGMEAKGSGRVRLAILRNRYQYTG